MSRDAACGEFSLTNCGPFDRALARAGLKSADLPQMLVRAFLPALVIWVPLLIFALLDPRGGGEARVTFFDDLSTHVRFLLVVPLLLIAEAAIGRRTRLVAAQFVSAELLTPADRPRFDALLGRAQGALQSSLAEVVIAALAVLFVVTAVRTLAADGVTFWFEQPGGEGKARISRGGWWYVGGCWLPPFLFLRWIWRYAVWCWLLQRWSHLDLRIVATHPDRSAGLSFVSLGHTAFSTVGCAVSCLVAAAIGARILHEGATLASFQWPLAVFVVLSIFVGIAPLAVFRRPLRLAKEAGLLEYGSFASRYVQEFHRKWLGGGAGEKPLAVQDDIGPLADIGACYERVDGVRFLPIPLKTTPAFAFAALAPMLPLLLTVMPLKELLKILVQAMI